MIGYQLFNASTLPLGVLIGILRRLYARVFKIADTDVPARLVSSIMAYNERNGMFSESYWPIQSLKATFSEEVCFPSCMLFNSKLIDLNQNDGDCDPILLWKTVDRKNPLTQLAILLLSFTPNSASCERVFSTMGNIKTKLRNRLGTKKTRDLAFLTLEIRRRQAIEGSLRRRLKRQFNVNPAGAFGDSSGSRIEEEELARAVCESDAGDDADNEGDEATGVHSAHVESEAPESFKSMAEALKQAVAEDEDDDEAGEVVEEAGTEFSSTRRVFSYFPHA